MRDEKVRVATTLYDEAGKVLAAQRKYCPVCHEHKMVEWREGDEPHALCLSVTCPYEY